MYRWVLTTTALVAFAVPASATVLVLGYIEKDKDITVTEDITITKVINVTATVTSTPDSVAEASAILNQENTQNDACENCAEKVDSIIGSINANSGISVTNQSAGNNNNQGSSIAIAVDLGSGGTNGEPPDPSDTSFANAQASVEQQNGGIYEPVFATESGELFGWQLVSDEGNVIEAVNLVFRDALIMDSVNGNAGVIHVNQSPSNNNNQANTLAIAVGLRPGGGVAIAEADLGQFNTYNEVHESNDSGDAENPAAVGIHKTATISGSVNFNSGVVGVNQTSGNMAKQANVVAVAAATVQ